MTTQRHTARRTEYARQSTPVLRGSRGVENFLYSTHPEPLYFFGRRMLLYNEMRQDDVLRSITDGIKMPISGAPFRIIPGGTDRQSKAMADFMLRALGMSDDTALDITWYQHVREMMNCIEFGFSMAEKVLVKYEDGEIGYKQLNYLPPLRFDWGRPWAVNDAGEMTGVRQGNNEGFWDEKYNKVIDIKRIIHFQYQYRDRQPDGESIYSAMWRDWKNRAELEEFEQIGVEHATGNTPVVYPPSPTDAAKGDEILEAIEEIRLGDRMGIVMPGRKQGQGIHGELLPTEGWLLEAFSSNMANCNVREIIESIDYRLFTRAFMQFMRLGAGKGGGSFALARTMMDLFILHLIDIQNNFTIHWQRHAVRHIYRLNLHKWPQAECPKIYWMPPALFDLTAVVNSYLQLADRGIFEPTDLDKMHWRTTLHLPQEYDGAQKLAKVEEIRDVQQTAATAARTPGRTSNGRSPGSPNRERGNLAGEPQTNQVRGRRPGNDGR